MGTDTCCICGVPFTGDSPAVNISTLLPTERQSPKHAWRVTAAGLGPACYDCANSQQSLPQNAVGTVALRSVAIDQTTEWDRGECVACGQSVLMPPSKRRQFFYCCDRHRAARYRALRVQESPTRACAQCGEPMTGRADKKFCSTRCRMAHHRSA